MRLGGWRPNAAQHRTAALHKEHTSRSRMNLGTVANLSGPTVDAGRTFSSMHYRHVTSLHLSGMCRRPSAQAESADAAALPRAPPRPPQPRVTGPPVPSAACQIPAAPQDRRGRHLRRRCKPPPASAAQAWSVCKVQRQSDRRIHSIEWLLVLHPEAHVRLMAS